MTTGGQDLGLKGLRVFVEERLMGEGIGGAMPGEGRQESQLEAGNANRNTGRPG